MHMLISKFKEPQHKGKACLSASLIIAEAGCAPDDHCEAYLFFRFISCRYEKSSTILTSKKSFVDRQELFGDAVISFAILDRLINNSKVINIKGPSYRPQAHTFSKPQYSSQEDEAVPSTPVLAPMGPGGGT